MIHAISEQNLQVAAGRDLNELLFPNRGGMLPPQLICERLKFLRGNLRAHAWRQFAPHPYAGIIEVATSLSSPFLIIFSTKTS